MSINNSSTSKGTIEASYTDSYGDTDHLFEFDVQSVTKNTNNSYTVKVGWNSGFLFSKYKMREIKLTKNGDNTVSVTVRQGDTKGLSPIAFANFNFYVTL